MYYEKMIRTILLYALWTAVLLAPYAGAARESACLDLEPVVVSVEGTLSAKIFPGPPNYESIEKGDKPIIYWVLEPDAPLCANVDTAGDAKTTLGGIRLIELVESPAHLPQMYRRHRKDVGKRVVVSGALFRKYAKEQVSDILIKVHAIRVAGGK